jgi:hypothetical protein
MCMKGGHDKYNQRVILKVPRGDSYLLRRRGEAI